MTTPQISDEELKKLLDIREKRRAYMRKYMRENRKKYVTTKYTRGEYNTKLKNTDAISASS